MKQQRKGTQPRRSARKRNLGRYKSGLEKQCADLLAENGVKFDYEEREYILVDSFRYEGKYLKMTTKKKELSDRTGKVVLPIKYTPDFVDREERWVIETKGYTPSHHDFPMRWKLFLRYLMTNFENPPMVFIVRNKQQIEEAIKVIKDGLQG
mgnify:CR=1 FL=1